MLGPCLYSVTYVIQDQRLGFGCFLGGDFNGSLGLLGEVGVGNVIDLNLCDFALGMWQHGKFMEIAAHDEFFFSKEL